MSVTFKQTFIGNLDLANSLHELGEPLIRLALLHVEVRNPIERGGHAFRGNRHDRQAVSAGVLFPLTAQYDLEVRHFKAFHGATDTIKPDVGHVVLAAAIEAAADLDVQILDRLI